MNGSRRLPQCGEGDRFIGVPVPAQRSIARRFRDLPIGEADKLLTSPIHEERLTAHRDAIRIATILVNDSHDLIHKAVGWMLREVDKRASRTALTAFLNRHAATMPRTMLRYAIERLPATRRRFWMARAAKIAF